MHERKYYYNKRTADIVYREIGKLHGDSQQDSDENPVYLLADLDEMNDAEMEEAFENEIQTD